MLESPHNEATNTVRNAISVLGRAVAILQKCPPDTELKAVSEVEEVNNLLRPLVLLSQPRKRKNCEPRVAISGHTLRRKARLNERKSEGQKALAQHPNLQFRGTGQQSVTQHDRPDSRGNKQTSGSGQDTSPHTDTFKVDSAVEEQAQFWMSDPASFWLDITAKDCGVPDGQSNLARFLCTALKVGNDTQIYTIKWRFYALVTYLLYKRIFCGSKNVMKDKIEQLSVQVGMTDSRQALKDLAVAGRRINDFKPSGDFGFLFNSLIPNSVWTQPSSVRSDRNDWQSKMLSADVPNYYSQLAQELINSQCESWHEKSGWTVLERAEVPSCGRLQRPWQAPASGAVVESGVSETGWRVDPPLRTVDLAPSSSSALGGDFRSFSDNVWSGSFEPMGYDSSWISHEDAVGVSTLTGEYELPEEPSSASQRVFEAANCLSNNALSHCGWERGVQGHADSWGEASTTTALRTSALISPT